MSLLSDNSQYNETNVRTWKRSCRYNASVDSSCFTFDANFSCSSAYCPQSTLVEAISADHLVNICDREMFPDWLQRWTPKTSKYICYFDWSRSRDPFTVYTKSHTNRCTPVTLPIADSADIAVLPSSDHILQNRAHFLPSLIDYMISRPRTLCPVFYI